MQMGYEPCEEDDDESSCSSNAEDDVGRKKSRRDDPIMALDRQMRKYVTNDDIEPDTLDRNKLEQHKFKASFISHLCAVKERKDEYKERLMTFDTKNNMKGMVVN